MSEQTSDPVEKLRWVQVGIAGEAPGEVLAPGQRTALVCRPNQLIARTIELLPDALGPPDSIESSRLRLGKNVAWDATGANVLALRAGQVCLRGGMLCVEEVLDLGEDVSAGGGVIDFPGDVVARQGVLDLVHLTATGDIVVHGCVEAANIKTGGSLTVHHGICGKDHGRIDAHGSVHAKFMTNALVHAGGDIVVRTEITNSRVFTRGKLDAERGTVLGGHIAALQDICCHTAGSPAGMKTVLEMGLAPDELTADQAAMDQLAALRHKSQQIRQSVEPLMKNLKRLTSAQKEKATELLCLADEAESMAADLAARLARHQADLAAAAAAPLRILHELHPGVTIRYPLTETTIRAAMRGPLKIILSVANGDCRIVAVDSRHGRLTPLPCEAVDARQEALIRKLREAA